MDILTVKVYQVHYPLSSKKGGIQTEVSDPKIGFRKQNRVSPENGSSVHTITNYPGITTVFTSSVQTLVSEDPHSDNGRKPVDSKSDCPRVNLVLT